MGFHTEICDFHEKRISKIGLLDRVKELSKPNQTPCGVSPLYLKSKRKKKIYYSLPRKKMGFHTEICDFHEKRILKIGLFDRVKELSKSNQTRCGVSPLYLKSKRKKILL